MNNSPNDLRISITDTNVAAQNIDITVAITNISKQMLVVRKENIYLAQMLHFINSQGDRGNCDRHLKYKAPLAKPIKLMPGESYTYTIALAVKETNAEEDTLHYYSKGIPYILQSKDCTFTLKLLGKHSLQAMVENRKPYDDLPKGTTTSDIWMGKAVSKPVTITIAAP